MSLPPAPSPRRAATRLGGLVALAALAALAALTALACSDRGIMDPVDETDLPELPPGAIAAALTCRVDAEAETFECEQSQASGLDGGGFSPIAGSVIVGGQDQYVRLSGSASTVLLSDGVTFRSQAGVTVENLIVQALGTEDGSTLHADGVRVFYHSGPTVTSGSGEVTVLLHDGVATYTDVDQPYYQYDEILAPGAVSASKFWRWEYPTTVGAFVFQVYVVAQVEHPDGWIDITPETVDLGVGADTTLSADVYSAVSLEPTAEVTWSTSDPSIATVDGAGTVSGVGDGYATITATSGALTADAGFTVGTPPPVDITGVSPSPMLAGEPATLSGSGFHPSADDNIVTVDGVQATVTSASDTELQIIVPDACRPPRDATVSVQVVDQSDQLTHPEEPASYVSLTVGQQLIITDPTQACVQFDATTSSEAYLLGVQHVSEVKEDSAQVTVTSEVAPTITTLAAPVALNDEVGVEPVEGLRTLDQDARQWMVDRSAETAVRERIHAQMPPAPQLATGDGTIMASIPEDVSVGDPVTLSFPDLSTQFPCEEPPLTVNGTVKANGTHAIWVNDDANPTHPDSSFSDQDFLDLAAEFDSYIYDADVGHFGLPSDIDANGKIVILVTEKLTFTLGFVSPNDLRSVSECTASNEAEIFYGGAPGVPINGFARDAAQMKEVYPKVIAHEFAHIIQYSRRMQLGAPFMTVWELEGQAVLAEEITGHTQTGLTTGGNYGWATLDANRDWYFNGFSILEDYFGYNGSSQVQGAPEECGFLGFTDPSYVPCNRAIRLHYGVTWSLLRWISDQYGPSYTGGEQQLHQDLIGGSTVGYDNLERVTGTPIETLLARWGAALYTDDRPEIASLDPALAFTSWNLYDIYYNSSWFNQYSQLTPRERAFTSYTDNLVVRASSAGYFRISGSERDATSVRVRDSVGEYLPAAMQIWLVRLQ